LYEGYISALSVSGDALLELGHGDRGEVRVSSDKLAANEDLRDGTEVVEVLEVGLDVGWGQSSSRNGRRSRLRTSVVSLVEPVVSCGPLQITITHSSTVISSVTPCRVFFAFLQYCHQRPLQPHNDQTNRAVGLAEDDNVVVLDSGIDNLLSGRHGCGADGRG